MTTPSAKQQTSSADSAEQIEQVAKAIYDSFEYPGPDDKPTWVMRGNSHKQDEARKYAEVAIAAIVPQVVQAPIDPELDEMTPPELLAHRLIGAWCDAHGKQIPWAKAIEITSIVTKMPDAERDRLLSFGSDAAPIVATVPSEPVAWLFVCKKPGKVTVYASVEENDTNHWPIDQWSSVEKQPLFDYAAPSPTEQASDVRNAALIVDIEKMVNRFLSWKLPQTFAPDCGILFKQVYADSWPTGTNLFHAGEAKAMFQHCLDTPADKGNAPVEGSENGYFTDEHGDGIGMVHPTYGVGVFFTEDCRKHEAIAQTAVESEAKDNWRDMIEILLDMYEDKGKPDEERTYVYGSFDTQMDEIKMLVNADKERL